MVSAAPRARARAREPISFAPSTILEIERAEQRELDQRISLNTEWMKRAELEGHVSELFDHYPGLMLWIVPADFVAKVGCMAAVVRA